MRAIRNLKLSVRALVVHRLRTSLAITGTAIGIAGVVALTTVAGSARDAVLRRFERMGRNMLVVTAAPLDARGGRAIRGYDRAKSLRVTDAAALRRAAGIVRVAAMHDRATIVKAGRYTTPVTVVGTTSDWIAIRAFRLASGRFIDDGDDAGRARVVVLGASAKASLFPDTLDAAGRTIRIDRTPFEVIGVLEPKGVSIDGRATEDDRIFVPLQTAMRRLFNIDYIKTIYLEGLDADVLDRAETDAADLLRARHDIGAGDEDDFVIQNQRVLLETELAAQASFRRLIIGLGVLALIAGGSGILALMLLSVRERRREIGLRIAVGARRRDIAMQFLGESLLLAFTGGIAGITLGALASRLIATFSTWPATTSPQAIITAGAAALLTGTLSGVPPAWRAASLDPVEGLTAE